MASEIYRRIEPCFPLANLSGDLVRLLAEDAALRRSPPRRSLSSGAGRNDDGTKKPRNERPDGPACLPTRGSLGTRRLRERREQETRLSQAATRNTVRNESRGIKFVFIIIFDTFTFYYYFLVHFIFYMYVCVCPQYGVLLFVFPTGATVWHERADHY